jgi:hypothetical protein
MLMSQTAANPDIDPVDYGPYGLSNDNLMAQNVNDVADHDAINLPMPKPKASKTTYVKSTKGKRTTGRG